MFDKAKLKLFMEMLKELAPELEFRIEKMRIKLKGDKEPKTWIAFLMRDKEKKAEKNETKRQKNTTKRTGLGQGSGSRINTKRQS